MLDNFARVYGFKYGMLHYFKASGAEQGAVNGEWHEPKTHLVSLVLRGGLIPPDRMRFRYRV